MTDFAAYKTRILSYVGDKDPIVMQREMLRLLPESIRNVSASDASRKPRPDKWSIVQIVAHLSETELVAAWRYRQMIETPGVALPGYDQNLWEKLGDYSARNMEDSLRAFIHLRTMNLNMFDKLSPEQWKAHGVHAERGPMTVRDLAAQMAGHDRNHLEQIKGAQR